MPKLSVHLVTWNGAQYFPYLFESLKNQTYRDWSLYIWDNASAAPSDVTALEKLADTLPVPWCGTFHDTNLGFAGGHNEVYFRTNEEYVVLLNQDLFLAPDCLEKLVVFMDAHPNAAAASPRLMKWDVNAPELQQSFTDTIDSLGLRVWRNRRVTEIGAGETWTDSDPTAREVFGVSGTLPIYRRAALQTVQFRPDQFFDNLYGSYKEDVDLAWRLQSAGYQAYVVTDAVAYHDRSAAGPRELSDTAAARNKTTQAVWVQYHSYKNHLMTLYKNERWQNFTLDFPWIMWYELKKFGWFLLFAPGVLKGLTEIWRNRHKLKSKRKQIQGKRKTTGSNLRKWWT